jgi:hypothetical protein
LNRRSLDHLGALDRPSKWPDTVSRYRAWEDTEDPAALVGIFGRNRPDKDAPAYVWVAWYEVQANCWARLAVRNPVFAWNDRLVEDYLRERVRRLKAEHPGQAVLTPAGRERALETTTQFSRTPGP